MPLHHRNFLTLDEVQERWQCSANDLKNLIVDGNLVPSFVINHVAFKVRFSWQKDCEPPYWQPDVVKTKTDEERLEPPSNLHETDGMYYLVHPQIEAPLDCKFFYFSKDRNHQMGPDDANVCLMLNSAGKHPLSKGITLQMVFEKGGLTMDEVLRYENAHASDVARTELAGATELSNQAAPDMDAMRSELATLRAMRNQMEAEILEPTGKSKNSLLRIIGGMAMAGFGLQIHERLTGISELVNDLAEVGVSVSEEHLRNRLREAAALIEPPPSS